MKPTNLLKSNNILARWHPVWPYLKYRVKTPSRLARRFMAIRGYPLTANERNLTTFKDKHQNQRCFVIGTGPSLKIDDLEKLDNEITFASNKIYLAFDQTKWRPTYYVAEDHLALEQNMIQIDNMTSVQKLFPIQITRWLPTIKDATFFYLIWQRFYPNQPCFSANAFKGLYWGSTVTYTLLQLACFMGIREIYLLGIDFNYQVPAGHEQGDESFVVGESQNHFHVDYLKPGDKSYPPNLHRHEKSYQAAKQAMMELEGKIYNATRGGNLEIFPRVDFDALF